MARTPPAGPLAARSAGAGPRLVLVHGFTQTGSCWAPVVADLAADHEVVTVDLPGHGGSAGVEPDADLWRSADLLGETAGTAIYVGYSLGGRVLLHLAVRRPELVEGLVLVGATAGLDGATARAERRAADAELADRIEAVGVEAFLDEWLALPLFAGLDATTDCREARRANTAAGLAASLRHVGTGNQEPLWHRLGDLTMPVLCVAGAHDGKFRREADRLVAAIGPTASGVVVPGAGHSVHLERPDAFLAALRGWLPQAER